MSVVGDLLDGEVHINIRGKVIRGYLTDVSVGGEEYWALGEISFKGKLDHNALNNLKDIYDNGCSAPIMHAVACCEVKEINQPEIMKDSIFYMNYMDGSSSPTHCFTDKADAEKEAARLAHAHQRSVYTLQAIARTEPQVNVTKTELKEKLIEAPKE